MAKIHTYDPRFSAMKKLQKNGKNSSTMLQDNRNLILRLIRENGAISRKELANESGLQQATVTIIIKELLSQGLIRENGMIDGGNGRRVKSFSMADDFYVIVVRLTGVYIKLSLVDMHIQLSHVKKIFFKTADYIKEAMGLIEEHIKEVEKMVDKEKILCIIIGVDHKYQLIDCDYSVWDETRQEYCPIGRKIHDQTGYNVFVNRAINFASYDAWERFKVAENKRNDYAMLVYIQLSYDLEGAIIVNHELVYGTDGLCGQLGNLQVDRKSDKTYNDVVTVPALLRRTKELMRDFPDSCVVNKDDLNIRNVIAGYESGDKLCRQVYDEVIEYMGYFIARILNWMDPDIVLLSDEVPMVPEFTEALRKEAAKYSNERKAGRIGSYYIERVTSNDPALSGGAKYAFDLLIGEIGLF